MILSDKTLRDALQAAEIAVSPLQEYSIQPASVELHLGDDFKLMRVIGTPIDLTQHYAGLFEDHPNTAEFYLYPGQFVLAHTQETVRMGNGYVGRVEGKSSLGRMGLAIHVTAGFIDPGFEGQITLELSNHTGNILMLTKGMKIAQLAIHTSHYSSALYGDPVFNSHYQGQRGAEVAKPV